MEGLSKTHAKDNNNVQKPIHLYKASNNNVYSSRLYDYESQLCYMDNVYVCHDLPYCMSYANVDSVQRDSQVDADHPMVGNPYSGNNGEFIYPTCMFTSELESTGYQSAGLYSSNFEYHDEQVNYHKHPTPVREVRPHHDFPTANGHKNNNKPHGEIHKCIVSFTNKYYVNTDSGMIRYLVFISNHRNINKLYFGDTYFGQNTAIILECHGVEVGYLELYCQICMPIMFYTSYSEHNAPRFVVEDYKKDQFFYELYDISYTEYMQKLIDTIILQQESLPCVVDTVDYADKSSYSVTYRRPVVVFTPEPDTLGSTSDVTSHDHNDTNKTLGFLSHESCDYSFIGRDRQPPSSNKLEKYISWALIIKDTKVPNCKEARFPVHSDLNIDAWRRHLVVYSNKHLIQYLTFGFPLSIASTHNLNNTTIVNHHSALQFPKAIHQYLDKEVPLGAILSPFEEINYQGFHCSPLLTRPKDGSKRRVILNLSYPSGTSPHERRQTLPSR